IRPIGWVRDSDYTGLALLVSRDAGVDPVVVPLSTFGVRSFRLPQRYGHVQFTWPGTGSRFLLESWRETRRGARHWTVFLGDARDGMTRILGGRRLGRAVLSPEGSVVLYQR